MIQTIEQRNPEYREHVQGGEGRMFRDPLVTDDKLGGACSFIGHITLEPGCSIGVHRHVGDSEVYFVAEGTGTYNDNGTEAQVSKGDVMYCPDGTTHGLKNTGEGLLRIVAIIQKTN